MASSPSIKKLRFDYQTLNSNKVRIMIELRAKRPLQNVLL